MAAKSKTPLNGEQIAAGATEALETFNTAISEASERGRAMIAKGLDTWTHEMQRFQEEMVAQGGATLEELKGCKSPLDVISVEQAWIAARSKAYMEAGLRFAQAFAQVANGMKPEASKTDHAA
jgi:hypothetical protein